MDAPGPVYLPVRGRCLSERGKGGAETGGLFGRFFHIAQELEFRAARGTTRGAAPGPTAFVETGETFNRVSPSQVHHGDLVAGAGQEFLQHVRRFQLEAAGADAGVAAEVLRLIDLPLHQKPHLMCLVVGKP